MSKEVEYMLAKHETNKVINNKRVNVAAERYLARKAQLRYERGLAVLAALCTAVMVLLFIWF